MEKVNPRLAWLGRVRPSLSQILISLLIVGLGFIGNRALSEVDQDLRIMYTEYTLAATDLAHISADIIRYRTTVIRALEAPSKKEFERITGSLPDQRARIQHAIDRYAAASLRVSRSGRSEPQDLEAVRQSLDAYIAAANRTINLLVQLWGGRICGRGRQSPHQGGTASGRQCRAQAHSSQLGLGSTFGDRGRGRQRHARRRNQDHPYDQRHPAHRKSLDRLSKSCAGTTFGRCAQVSTACLAALDR